MLLAGRPEPGGSQLPPEPSALDSGMAGRRPSRRRWSVSLWLAIVNSQLSSGRCGS